MFLHKSLTVELGFASLVINWYSQTTLSTRHVYISDQPQMLSLLPTLLIAATAQAAVLTIQSPRLTVTDATGSQLRSESWAFQRFLKSPLDLWSLRIRLSLTHKPSTPVQLGEAEILKVVFQIVDQDTGSGVQPHQTFIRFYDEKSKEEGVHPVRVTPGGKAKFDLVRALSPFISLICLKFFSNRTSENLQLHYPLHPTAILSKSPS